MKRQAKKKSETDSPTPDAIELSAVVVDIEAAADGEKLPTFKMVGYTGAVMNLGWMGQVVVDLAGLKLPARSVPIRLGHESANGVGHTTKVSVKDGKLVAEGVVSRDTEAAREVVAAAKKGFPWQASIGASIEKLERLSERETATVNGKVFKGPLTIVRNSTLGEISFVDLGADSRTTVKIAAQAREEADMAEPIIDTTAEDTPPATPQDPDRIALERERMAAELDRQSAIQLVCKGHLAIAAQAIRDGWTVEKAEVEVLKAERPKQVDNNVTTNQVPKADVLAAAAVMSIDSSLAEKQFDAPTLDAAHSCFRHGLGLQELLILQAQANGYAGRGRITTGNAREVLRAAFSTISLPGILSTVANKFLLESFMAVEDTWRQICSTRPVNDFKTSTSYRLTGDLTFEKVSPAGEITHGKVDEESFTNKADTYARMLAITRTDIINDDLGALQAVPRKIGRGAALALNKVFWTEFMDNSSFFTSELGAYAEGSATALGINGLTAAELLFLTQTDADGDPLALTPRILLVPPALLVTASQIMNSTEIRDTTSTTKYATSNPHAGKFTVAMSRYLSDANITGYSAAAWYLLANPADLSTIEVAFLNGVQTPVVESADADFNVLGIQMRGYFDFGVSKQDYRAGVKMKGSA